MSVLRALQPAEGEVAGSDGGLSLATLYAKYAGAVFARCRYLLRTEAEAEDAMQEVFARAMGHLGEFRNEASPLTWLITIATRHCLNVIRGKGAAWHAQYAAREQAKGEAGEPELGQRELVRQVLSMFDEETQAAAVLYHVDELTLEEVAAALGRSVPTVRKRLADFAERARAELEGKEPST
jgi:RNA polymerase sigma-70 factor (ECF subfamily)